MWTSKMDKKDQIMRLFLARCSAQAEELFLKYCNFNTHIFKFQDGILNIVMLYGTNYALNNSLQIYTN